MWGSLLDATKDLADKARKAAEELERNLNDSAGVVNHAANVVTTPERPDRTDDLIHDNDDDDDDDAGIVNNNNDNNNDDDDDLNCDDAWDDDDDDIDIPDTDEPQITEREGEINKDATMKNNNNNNNNNSDHLITTSTTNHPPPESVPDQESSTTISAAETVTTTAMPSATFMAMVEEDPPIHHDDDPILPEEPEPLRQIEPGIQDRVDQDDDIHQDDDDDDTRMHPMEKTEDKTHVEVTEAAAVPATFDGPAGGRTSFWTTTTSTTEPVVVTADVTTMVPESIVSRVEDRLQPPQVHQDKADDVDYDTTMNHINHERWSLPPDETLTDMGDDHEENHHCAVHVHPNADAPIPVSELSMDPTSDDIPEEATMTTTTVEDRSPWPPPTTVMEPETRTTVVPDGPGHESNDNVGEPWIHNGTRHVDISDQRNATTVPVVLAPTSLGDDNDNDANKDFASIIDKLLSNEVARKMLEENYSLAVTRDDDKNAKGSGAVSIQQLLEELHQREQQLFSKTEQITMMEAMHETEKQDLLSKIQSTKDEAKRRIQKAKERVDAVETKLKNMTSQQTTSSAAQEETIQQQTVLITELRKEGEKLAQKQAGMELVVRASKTETRELRKEIDDLEEETNRLSEKLRVLEVDYKDAQDQLSSARQGMSQVDHLDNELRSVREENEKRASTILTLEQAVKELKATNKEMENELKVTRKGAALESEQERKRLIMEHGQVVSDMEMKFQASEREAAIREDALRVEIDDLRKRWQESVRRADTLSVDIQANTAPLLRQIDSINKQSRIRATAWAELETQLRNEIENSIVTHEKLTKECNEWKTKVGRLDRTNKEYEAEVKQLKAELYEQHDAVQKLQHQYDEALYEIKQLKASLSDMERLSNESVARVRSEITRKMVDSEEQYRIQIESLEQQLQEEQNVRSKVEVQLMEQQSYKNHNDASNDNDIDGSAMLVQPSTSSKNDTDSQQRLRQSQDQAEILVGALGGIVGSEYDDEDTTNDGEHDNPTSNGPMNSYAALEELTSRLKASKMELGTLRTRLVESEKIRNELLVIVDEARVAREQLPLVEQRVQELTMENHELQLEIQGLKDDIADVRELYRTQLNVLLEAQAVSGKTTVDEQNALAL